MILPLWYNPLQVVTSIYVKIVLYDHPENLKYSFYNLNKDVETESIISTNWKECLVPWNNSSSLLCLW